MIPSLSKAALQDVVKLQQKKYRDKQKRYLVKGWNAVQGCLEQPGPQIEAVLVQHGEEAYLQKLPAEIRKQAFLLSEKEFKRIGDERAPQGIALLVKRPETRPDWAAASCKKIIYLEEINDPGNLGTIIRSALWFGADSIWLSPGSADPFQPKVVRASAGFVAHAALFEGVDTQQLEQFKIEKNALIAGTVLQRGQSVRTWSPPQNRPWLLAFGSEAHGLSPQMEALCDVRLTIPRAGVGESLNLGVSVAICLYAFGATV
jgi:TrmH family RNA methyltransferase